MQLANTLPAIHHNKRSELIVTFFQEKNLSTTTLSRNNSIDKHQAANNKHVFKVNLNNICFIEIRYSNFFGIICPKMKLF